MREKERERGRTLYYEKEEREVFTLSLPLSSLKGDDDLFESIDDDDDDDDVDDDDDDDESIDDEEEERRDVDDW